MNLDQLQNQPFIQALQTKGEVFVVGGVVRDLLMNRSSKDLDILVTEIPLEEIAKLIEPFGKVDLVGKSFGVVKLILLGETEAIDIAIPRTERKMTLEEMTKTAVEGHTAFVVNANHRLSIVNDLERRDLTINSIAMRLDGTFIDPFNGRQDIEDKTIRVTNPQAFKDDPLRAMRAIQFSARFDFKIEPCTWRLIREIAPQVKTISGERILMELDKIVLKKGNIFSAIADLNESRLFENLFGFKWSNRFMIDWSAIKTRAEFYLYLLQGSQKPDETFRAILRGDIDTAKEIKALVYGFENADLDIVKNRWTVFKMLRIAPSVLDSQILHLALDLEVALKEIQDSKFPRSFKDLTVNGNDLEELGLKGEIVGKTLNYLLDLILSEKCTNDKDLLLGHLSKK